MLKKITTEAPAEQIQLLEDRIRRQSIIIATKTDMIDALEDKINQLNTTICGRCRIE